MLENHDPILQTCNYHSSWTRPGYTQETSRSIHNNSWPSQIPYRRSLGHTTPTKTDAGSLRQNIQGLRQQ
jgi:hypothetical protein